MWLEKKYFYTELILWLEMWDTVKLVHYCLLPDLVVLDLKKLSAKHWMTSLHGRLGMTRALQRYKMQEAQNEF